ncbi:hypothetical protein GOP47_0030614 [Adiantum capillus-veneris]|nr:hypothetical protein GOP47_0030614 [Adiantum capillus-veneris]
MDVFVGGIVSKVLDEGHGVSEHEVEEDPEAPDIYAMVVASLDELRRTEGRGSNMGVIKPLPGMLHPRSMPKVCQQHLM